MEFATLAYAKLNLEFDRELFCHQYDKYILPNAHAIANGHNSVVLTEGLNKIWKMLDPELYFKSDRYSYSDSTVRDYIKGEFPAWNMFQMMELDTTDVVDSQLIKYAKIGGSSVRNETLDKNFKLKPGCEKLEITKWIHKNLPFKKINSIHCVSIEAGGFGTIHRDSVGLYRNKEGLQNNESSIGKNKVYTNGFVIINLNFSDGGVPLYWALDNEASTTCRQTNELVYITNDYFLHGVPVCTSRRRQIRITGIPTDKLWDLIKKDSIVDIGDNYKYSEKYV